MSSFKEARGVYHEALRSGKTGSDLAVFARAWLSSASMYDEVFEVWKEIASAELGEDDLKRKEFITRILDAEDVGGDDCWELIYNHTEDGSAEETMAFDKLLSFCEDKEDVENVMDRITGWGGNLDLEHFYLKIFARSRDLPDRPPSEEEED